MYIAIANKDKHTDLQADTPTHKLTHDKHPDTRIYAHTQTLKNSNTDRHTLTDRHKSTHTHSHSHTHTYTYTHSNFKTETVNDWRSDNATLTPGLHLRGWAEKFIAWLWCNGRIWPKLWFIFQHSLPCGPHTSSIGVAVLGFPWYRSSHPDPRKNLNCRYDLIIGPILLPSH